MDLTSTDILFGLGAVAAAVVVASAVYWFSGRLTRPVAPASIPVSPAPATPKPAPAAGPPAPPTGDRTTAWTKDTTAAWTEDMTGVWSASQAAARADDGTAAWTTDQITAWATDQAAAPQPRSAPGADPHGRHRAPEELLRASTYRLSADRIARAKVLGQADQVSQAIPSPSRSSS